MRQQTLPLKLPQLKTFESFVGAANDALIHTLKSLSPTSMIYLWGKSGAGCSHLLQATCDYWQQQSWHTLYLDLRQADLLDVLLKGGAEGLQLLAMDHLEAALGKPEVEEKLFHLFNRATQTPFALLWGAHKSPKTISCHLADLSSRLNAALTFQIKNPTDTEQQKILQQYAQQQGFELNTTLTKFLLTHHSRNLEKLLNLTKQLDQINLQTHRRLTIPLLKKFLLESKE